VLDCPGGTFQGAGVKTVVLFFEKGSPTRKVWYYQLSEETLGRRLGKTNPLNDTDLSEFIDLQKSFADSDHSWSLDVNDVDDATCDLSVKNPNRDDEVELRQPDAILEEIASLDAESSNILNNIKTLVGS
jgi:type I restriction enzyme M protein